MKKNTKKRGVARTKVRVATKTTNNEITALGKMLRQLGKTGGTMVGGMIGHPNLGGAAGQGLGAAVSKWLGQGDYTVKQNSIVTRSLKASSAIPMMHKEGQTVIVRHKEFLGPLRGSVGFKIQRELSINPGNFETFPWLSKVAAAYQEYTLKGLVYHYVPTSGYAVSGSNPALGSVMMQTSYRATESAPVDKVEMLNEYWACETIPSEALAHPIECDPSQNVMKAQFIRSGGEDVDALFYDLGKTFIATQGQPADDNVIGDLWVTYEVELRKPVVRSSVVAFAGSALFTSVGNASPASPIPSMQQVYGDTRVTIEGRSIKLGTGLVGNFVITVTYNNNVATNWTLTSAPDIVNVTTIQLFPGINRLETTATNSTTASYTYYCTKPDIAQEATITLPATWTFGNGSSRIVLSVNSL